MSALPQSAQLHEILATPVCIAATHPKMARGKPQTTGTSDSADGSQAELRSQNGPTAIQPRCHSDTTYLRSLALDALVTGSGHHDEMVQAATGGRCQLPGMSVGELVTADEDALGNAGDGADGVSIDAQPDQAGRQLTALRRERYNLWPS